MKPLPIQLSLAAMAAFTFTSAHAQDPVTLVDYSQSWKIMNPLGGVLPPLPAAAGGGADVNFESTWYLKENSFLTQYDGPNFGANGIAGSYEALEGPGPFAVGGIDGIADGTTVGPAGTVITLPASGNRFTSFYRTTFTTTIGMGSLNLELLCDDGVFIYLDGNRIAQENMPDLAAGANPAFTLLATAARDENLVTTIDLSQAPGGNVLSTVSGLAPGVHTLAVELHQSSATSSDLGLALKLTGVETVGQCIVEASVSDIVRGNAGTPANPTDDTFTFKVTVNGSNAGTSWKSDATPATGNYGASTNFGPFPVSDGVKTVTFSAGNDPACTAIINVTPPGSSISAVTSNVTRDQNGTPVDPRDDTFSFDVTATGTFVSPEWSFQLPQPGTGTYNTAKKLGPFPVNAAAVVAITDSVDLNTTTTVTVQPPRYVPPIAVVPYNQTWQVMNPQTGVLPEGPDGVDDNFESTWYLPQADFATQYNGPFFGANGVAGDYEAITGPGPLAVGGVDGLAAGTTLGAVGTALTLPATGSRLTSYYRTTFTTTQIIDNLKFDILCDDGVFIYLDGVLVARENMPGADTFDALATGARAETLITTIDLSEDPGTNVVAKVNRLAIGTHTLAVSLHQSAIDSSDIGLALTFYGRTSTGCEVLPVAGVVTRNLNNTLTTDDDTFRFPITVNATLGGPAGWTSNSVPAAGGYGGTASNFGPFPVSDSPKSITFTDTRDTLCRTTAMVDVPPIFGLTSFNGTVSAIPPTLPLPTNWTGIGSTISHRSNVGVAAPGSTLSSGVVNLVSISGPVQFRMNLVLSETSATSNFEAADTVLAELVLRKGAVEERVNLITSFDKNSDGVLNGFTGADVAEYNASKDQDELNGAGDDGEASVNHTFELSSVIADDVTSAQVVVTVVSIGGTESITVTNMTLSPATVVPTTDTDGDGQTDESEAFAGTSPTNPADVLRISGITPSGAGINITFPSKSGRNYRLETSNRLGTWAPFGSVIPGTGSNISANVTQIPLPGEAKYFIRIRVVP
jgi:hypothetical protein